MQAFHPAAASIMDGVNQYFSVTLLRWVAGWVSQGRRKQIKSGMALTWTRVRSTRVGESVGGGVPLPRCGNF